MNHIGNLFDIQRWSLHDGDGIRTVIFLKGCPLRCLWCCNPESQVDAPQINIFSERCSSCGACMEACPEKNALSAMKGGFIDRNSCTGCGACARVCAKGARNILGMSMSADEIMKEILKDGIFYRRSGGGVTFSGGEPFLQSSILREVISRCHAIGLSTAVETSGFFSWRDNMDIIQKLDMVLMDIKHMDSPTHQKITGVSNHRILSNARSISNENIPMIIRVPVVPGINDSLENINAIVQFVRTLKSLRYMELLPYHTLGKGKYSTLGMQYALEGVMPPEEEHLEKLKQIIRDNDIVVL